MTTEIRLGAAPGVSTLLDVADRPRFVYVVAHGAGAGMRHPFLEGVARALVASGGAALRYQFPYMEAGKSRVDSPDVATATVRAAVEAAASRLPGVPIVAGGKSFGGRMTSEAQARAPLPGVRGLAFLGFPLHPPGKPGTSRAEHLTRVDIPMLFLQGTRDEFAQLDLLQPLVASLAPRATLVLTEDGDHSFAVRKKVTGRSSADAFATMCDDLVAWISRVIA